MTKKKMRGTLIDHGVVLELHEKMTIEFLIACGHDVEILLPSNTANNYNPDIIMGGIIWEMKSPVVGTNASLARLFRHAAKQSCNILFDLRRLKMKDEMRIVRLLNQLLRTSNRAKRLLIINHRNELLEFCKNKP